MLVGRAIGVAVGIVLDEVFGEPPDAIHPMVYVGRGLGRLECTTYRPTIVAGLGHAALVIGAWSVGRIIERRLGPSVSTAIFVWIASSGRLLRSSAAAVADGLEIGRAAGDLAPARSAIRSLVGRDSTLLDEGELCRAAVESVAENTIDAVVGSAFWGLVAGPAGVAVHRVANTLDAMVGHRSERYRRFGWTSAKLDDGLNFLPARTGVAAVMLARPGLACPTAQTVRRDGCRHPSPNGGRIEAAFAEALGLSLGGVNRYGATTEVRGSLGTGRPPAADDIEQANRLSQKVSALTGIGLPVLVAAAVGTCRAASSRIRG